MNRSIIDHAKHTDRVNCKQTLLDSVLWVGLLLVVGPAIASASAGTQDPQLESAVLAQDWEKVIVLLSDGNEPNLPAPLRLIKGHACLATNRNNQSLCLFLRSSSETDLRQWEEWTEEFLRRHPGVAVAQYLAGDCAARRQQWDRAIAHLNAALEIDPNHVLILNARGVAHASIGKLDLAGDDFRKASRGAPALAEVFASRGTYVLHRKTDAKKAYQWFDQALRIAPDYILALNGRGSSATLLQNWEQASTDLKEARALATGCLSDVAGAVDLNLAFLVDERNGMVSKMFASLGGLEPGFSVQEKINILDGMSPAQRQLGYDLMNNAKNFNNGIQGGFFNPSKTELGVTGGVKGSIIGPRPYIEGKASATWDWAGKAQYNAGQQNDIMDAMSQRYGINQAKPINNFDAFLMQHALPGGDYGKLTSPKGVSSREIGERSFGTSNWNVFTMYGLLYRLNSSAHSSLDGEKSDENSK